MLWSRPNQVVSKSDCDMSLVSNTCLQGLDVLYVDAAEKLREYDLLRIEKDKIFLEFQKLDQEITNAKEK